MEIKDMFWVLGFFTTVCVVGPFVLLYIYICQGCVCRHCRYIQLRNYLQPNKAAKAPMPTPPKRAWVVVQTPGMDTFIGLNEYDPTKED